MTLTRDSIGNRLEVGDIVCFVGSYDKTMHTARFLGLTKGGNYRVEHTCRHRYQVYKVMQPEVTYDQYLEKTGAPRGKKSKDQWLALLEEADA